MGPIRIIIFVVAIVVVDCSSYHELERAPSPNHMDFGQTFYNQQSRPTQFHSTPQQLFSVQTRGASLILPANNNEHIANHPSRYNNDDSHKIVVGDNFKLPGRRSEPTTTTTTTTTTESSRSNFLQGNIELALRQASGDENVFQPSPTIGSHDMVTGWTSTANNAYDRAFPVVSTTEQSNNILVQSTDYYQQELQKLAEQQSTAPVVSNSAQNTTLELNGNNNQVFYEGPATPAQPSHGDYYFSSSEMPNSPEKSSNVWWALGIGQSFEETSNLTLNDYQDYCSRSELLISNKQRSLCKSHPKVLPIVARGLKLAIDECQARFAKNRWNCSLVAIQESMLSTNDENQQGKHQVFGDVMRNPNRERSFLNAIIAAALAHSMTKACSAGELPEECSCDKKIRSRSKAGKIEWIACSDDIDYGARFSREFTDNTDSYSTESETTLSMINSHNYEVGRRVFKSATDITCTCQPTIGSDLTSSGASADAHSNTIGGLCQTKKCWKHLSPFTDIGDELMKRYESATHVQLSNRDPHKLRPVRRGVRKPKRKDLVYIDESPDYCSPDNRLGILGTQNRHCNSTSQGPDSCSLLCCGRGYQVVVEKIEEECNCKFVWCCQVKCDKCKKQVTYDVCN